MRSRRPKRPGFLGLGLGLSMQNFVAGLRAPAAPTDLTAVGLTGTTSLNLTPVVGAASYSFRRSPTGAATWSTPTGGTAVTSLPFVDVDAPLESDDYEAQAVNAAGSSGWSKIATASAWLGCDNFTSADNTDITASTSVVGAAWVEAAGTFYTQSNGIQPNSYVNGDLATQDNGQADFTAICAFTYRKTNGSNWATLMFVFRYTDTNNYWTCALDGSNIFYIQERAAGSSTTRASTAFTGVDGTTYTVQINALGMALAGKVDGGSNISYGSASSNQTATKHGIRLAKVGTPPAKPVADNWKVSHP